VPVGIDDVDDALPHAVVEMLPGARPGGEGRERIAVEPSGIGAALLKIP
jgi:hypothetical protein